MLVERAGVADPLRVDAHVEALDHAAAAVLEHPPAVDGAVEVAREVEHRALGAVVGNVDGRTAAESEDGECGEQAAAVHGADLQRVSNQTRVSAAPAFSTHGTAA